MGMVVCGDGAGAGREGDWHLGEMHVSSCTRRLY